MPLATMAQEDAPKETALADMQKENPNLLFIIERSKNKNVVCYAAKMKGGQIDPDDPIEAYWMDIDPEYVKAARAKGVTSDRVELGVMESKLAYG